MAISDHIRDILDSVVPEMDPEELSLAYDVNIPPEEVKGLTFERLMAYRIVHKAVRTGDVSMLTMVLDRTEGRPKIVTENKHHIENYTDVLHRLAREDPTLLEDSPEDEYPEVLEARAVPERNPIEDLL